MSAHKINEKNDCDPIKELASSHV